jgi:hypothetical protein
VESKDLIPQQAQRIRDVVGRHLRYLGRLRERMNVMSFPRADPLFVSVTAAYHAVHELNVRLRYLACESGVGEPAKPRRGSGSA